MAPPRRAGSRPSAPSRSDLSDRPDSQAVKRGTRVILTLTRVWLPVVVAVAGLAGIAVGHGSVNSIWAAGGVSLVIVAIMIWMINWMFRMSVESNRERDREEQAREYFDRHGRWPDE